MILKVKSSILGFESLQNVVLKRVDKLFSTLYATDDNLIGFTILNPYSIISEYDIQIPQLVKLSLEIISSSHISVYCMVVVQEPINSSLINFLAPIIINDDKKLLAQVILDPLDYPNLTMQDSISKFIK